ncbi:MAG: leucine--tRNA ligase, partial [Piscirickettsiaceae bacterium]|nr:leucine--tRNA ligase [Piscirickettsiaceae bacterium]
RDYEFAQAYNLKIKQVIEPIDGNTVCDLTKSAFTTKGRLINSEQFDGLTSSQAFNAIAKFLQQQNKGKRQVNYRLRDWGISRQRYWGTPIPIINCQNCGEIPIPEQDLPVQLPENITLYRSSSPIKSMPDFYKCICPACGDNAKRETDTFDTFFESSWYYARFTCPDNNESMLDNRTDYWLPVDQYIGGIEHAVLHLLYARFFHKLMRDEGLLKGNEPFKNLLTQGMVLKDSTKMSKSRGNIVNPQSLIDKYGADTARLFMMFAAPPEQSLEWSDKAAAGANRFLKRLWRMTHKHIEKGRVTVPDDVNTLTQSLQKIRRQSFKTLEKVTDDIGRRHTFNTAIAAVMKLINKILKINDDSEQAQFVMQETIEMVVLMLAPITPHICHELWKILGHDDAIVNANWPKINVFTSSQGDIDIMVQVNGKLRSKISVFPNSDDVTIKMLALAKEGVLRLTQGKKINRIILVPKRLVNIVVANFD